MKDKKKKFLSTLKKDLKDKRKLKGSLIFLIFFVILFTLIYLILSKTIIYNLINYSYGYLSNVLLNLFSINSIFHFDYLLNISVLIVNGISYPITIGSLCTGILEFSLLSSAILASRGVKWINRIKWAVLSIIIVTVFNIFRIVFTVFLIKNINLITATFFHGFLFRIFLMIIVIGTYWLFYRSYLQ